jgi:hypothetical protein
MDTFKYLRSFYGGVMNELQRYLIDLLRMNFNDQRYDFNGIYRSRVGFVYAYLDILLK